MSDDGSDGEVYEVEKILDKRTKKGKTEYLIKWKGKCKAGGVLVAQSETLHRVAGYEDEAENTWEPTDNLDCEDKIQDFEKRHKVVTAFILYLITSFHNNWNLIRMVHQIR